MQTLPKINLNLDRHSLKGPLTRAARASLGLGLLYSHRTNRTRWPTNRGGLKGLRSRNRLTKGRETRKLARDLARHWDSKLRVQAHLRNQPQLALLGEDSDQV